MGSTRFNSPVFASGCTGWINIYAAVFNEDHPGLLDFSQRYGKQFIWIIASLILAVL